MKKPKDYPIHFAKGDIVLARYMDRLLRGKVLFIYKNKTASIIIEEGQHPITYSTHRFHWSDIYNPS